MAISAAAGRYFAAPGRPRGRGGCAGGWGRCHELRQERGYTMARYIFSDSYAATVLPIIREVHLEILARNPPGAAVSNLAIDREIRASPHGTRSRDNARRQLDPGAG